MPLKKREFTVAQTEYILTETRRGKSSSMLAREFHTHHRTIEGLLAQWGISKEFAPQKAMLCLRCRILFRSKDRKYNRICEKCTKYIEHNGITPFDE